MFISFCCDALLQILSNFHPCVTQNISLLSLQDNHIVIIFSHIDVVDKEWHSSGIGGITAVSTVLPREWV